MWIALHVDCPSCGLPFVWIAYKIHQNSSKNAKSGARSIEFTNREYLANSPGTLKWERAHRPTQRHQAITPIIQQLFYPLILLTHRSFQKSSNSQNVWSCDRKMQRFWAKDYNTQSGNKESEGKGPSSWMSLLLPRIGYPKVRCRIGWLVTICEGKWLRQNGNQVFVIFLNIRVTATP